MKTQTNHIIKLGLNSEQKGSFASPNSIKEEMLPQGKMLWRLMDNNWTPRDLKSCYWIDSKGLDIIFSRIYERINIEKIIDSTHNIFKQVYSDLAALPLETRDVHTDKYRINELRHICEGEVKRGLEAYYGRIGKFKGESKVQKRMFERDGGAMQYVIPLLDRSQKEVRLENYFVYKIIPIEQSSWYKRFVKNISSI
jgi:hypothetical protein